MNNIEVYEIDQNDGTQDVNTEIAYEVKYSNPVCPCCGKKLNFIDSLENDFGQELTLTTESTKLLKENSLSDYLLDICTEEALDLYENEVQSHTPDIDINGNISAEYNERFIYTDDNLKKVIKVRSTAIANKLKESGINVNSFYIEQEIIESLKCLFR